MKKTLSVILICAMLITGACGIASAGTAKLIVNIDPTYLSPFGAFEGWGTSLCWWANYFGDLPEKQRKELVAAFFDEKEGLGLNIARYNIGGGDDPTHNHIRDDGGAVPGYLSADGKWDWDADARQVNILKDAIEEGVNIVEAFSNSPPYFMTVSGCASGNTDASVDNIDPSRYEEFADYLTEVVKYLKEKHNIKVNTLEPMNEPDTDFWRAFGRQEGCHISGEYQSDLIIAVGKKLKEKGLTDTVVSASDETSVDKALENLRKYTPEALSYLGQVNTHTYSGSNYEGLRDAAAALGKKLYMSETDSSNILGTNAGNMGPALWLSQKITTDLNRLQSAAWVLWQVVGPYYEGYNSDRGYWYLATYDKEKYQLYLYKKYYAFAHFTKFIRPGYYLIGSDNPSVLSAYDKESGKIIIVVTNSSEGDIDYTFDLSSFGAVGTKLETYRTSVNQNLEKLEDKTVSGKSFSDLVPQNTITTYVITPEKELKPELYGMAVYEKGGKLSPFVGDTLYMSARFDPADYPAKEIRWSVAEPDGVTPSSKAVIDGNGILTVKGTGSFRVIGTLKAHPDIKSAVSFNAIDTNRFVKIIGKSSGKALQPRTSLKTAGEEMVISSDRNYTIQQWYLERVGGEYFIFTNSRTGLALTEGGDVQHGKALIQAEYTGAENQQWKLEQVNGYFLIINRASGRSIDVFTASTRESAQVGTYEVNRGDNQLFKIELAGQYPALEPLAQTSSRRLMGRPFGTTGEERDRGRMFGAFDNNPSTYFEAPSANGGYIGIDLGENNAKEVTKIRYLAREGFETRMLGGVFQGANNIDGPYTDIHKITEAPAPGSWVEVNIKDSGAFRYIRYLSPDGGYCNIAEMEFYDDPVPVKADYSEANATFTATLQNNIIDTNLLFIYAYYKNKKLSHTQVIGQTLKENEGAAFEMALDRSYDYVQICIIAPSTSKQLLYSAHINLK